LNFNKKIILSTARDFFARGDMLLLFLCVLASIFGVVVISSATASTGSICQGSDLGPFGKSGF
jgi:hypothetical protein